MSARKCEAHQPQQHRDGKPPWCRKCGLTADMELPTTILERPSYSSNEERERDIRRTVILAKRRGER